MAENAARPRGNPGGQPRVRVVHRCVGAALSRQTHSHRGAVCARRHHRRARPRPRPAAIGGLGQQVVIENKPGGGTGQVGAEYVARSAPDGYTLLVTADATFVTSPHVYSKLPYDPINDFVAITGLGISTQALVVHPSLPVRTLSDLVDFAKKRPGELNYGTFGIGSSGHLNIILLEGMTGTRFTPVHYRGAAP